MKNGKHQQGVVLITTLIMLAVVTLMAVAFLAISRRERASVTVTKDQTVAQWMAETALQRAKGEVSAQMQSKTNLLHYDYQVSTNFISPQGFQTGNANPTNVSYTYGNGAALQGDDQLQNLRNLQYDPRPPVFVETNAAGDQEFRFYHDLNRNRAYDTNRNRVQALAGGGGEEDAQGPPEPWRGDPEWIGVLENPELAHSGDNRFIGRYAYMVLPVGKSLDLNFIHNQAKRLGEEEAGYVRNQGVGSWELNLGAFLQGLNPNVWDGAYIDQMDTPSEGTAYRDALALLRHRYRDGDYTTLDSVSAHFAGRADEAFQNDGIDGYSDGPFQNSTLPLQAENDNDDPTLPWPGSDNAQGYSDINQLFSVESFFNDPDTANDFAGRLQALGDPGETPYNNRTYYRLISQLGLESTPANRDKIHLNYRNLDGFDAAEFIPWQAAEDGATNFFHHVANGLLSEHFDFGVTNIPIYPTNGYTAEVQQLLQLAANIYDAGRTNQALRAAGDQSVEALEYPTVFRPVFATADGGDRVFIQRYEEVGEGGARHFDNPWRDLRYRAQRRFLQPNDNVFGIPWIVAARKGHPNFNEFSLETWVQMTRKLQLRKRSRFTSAPNETNQMYILSVSNRFGVEAWNSYETAYSGDVRLQVTNRSTMVLSNQNRIIWEDQRNQGEDETVSNWRAWSGSQMDGSFQVPMTNSVVSIEPSAYYEGQDEPIVPLSSDPGFESSFSIPQLELVTTNQVQFMLSDPETGRVIDFVNLDNLVSRIDVTERLTGNIEEGGTSVAGAFWLTERVGGAASPNIPPRGIINQIEASKGAFENARWVSESGHPVTGRDKEKAIDTFRVFVGLSPLNYPPNQLPPSGRTMQAPFTPARKFYQANSWQANDPLVHYTPADLHDLERPPVTETIVPPQTGTQDNNLGRLNPRYRPWGGHPDRDPAGDPEALNMAVKDPEVMGSDDWQFLSQPFPNVGWLGRVHRGTPWQTVYFKSADLQNLNMGRNEPEEPLSARRWARWSGHRTVPHASHPTNDWALAGLFTTAPNDNAARGLLSVNQSGRAGWAAALGGVSVLPHARLEPDTPPPETLIRPATAEFQSIVDGINRARERVFDGTYPNRGSVLATPELTVRSPYLQPGQGPITDPVVERIPQQVLSLLKARDPMVVIYAYGQALEPASVVRSPGPFYQMPTNYRITGEYVTKTLMRFKGDPENITTEVETYSVVPGD